MVNEVLTIYESLDLRKTKFFKSSYFYTLNPVGVGETHVESLTGYIARLAEAHCVSVVMLITKGLSKYLEQRGKVVPLKRVRSYLGWLNGAGDMATRR
ncbi:MAG: hypothetical protein Kow00121_05750 [Elainellaceae cyanobacterium]